MCHGTDEIIWWRIHERPNRILMRLQISFLEISCYVVVVNVPKLMFLDLKINVTIKDVGIFHVCKLNVLCALLWLLQVSLKLSRTPLESSDA